MAYLEELSGVQGFIVDSAVLSKNGEFQFSLKAKDDQHKLYNVVYDWSTIPIFAASGDKIKLNSVGNVAKNYTVEGSEESELIRSFYQNFIKGITTLDKIAMEYADESISEEQRTELARSYSQEHNNIKRAQIEFIVQNKASLAAVYALYQRLPNDSYLFNGRSDVIYYRTVAEALDVSYPESPYRKIIQSYIDDFDAANTLSNEIQEIGYPDLEINDILGKPQKLSDLEGKVILLDFWSAQSGSSNQHNAELKSIYTELQPKGFEVYQVGIDSSKSVWVNAVQSQGLPWISVCDFKGGKSPAVAFYNLTALPANFLISKDGEIVASALSGDELVAKIKAELAK